MNSSADSRAIVLVGPMGAGKTSIGKKVARDLAMPFTDTDAVIVAEHGPIPEIFSAHGEAHFRAIERDVVAAALAHGGVISLGGGSVIDARTRADLAAHRVVFLTVAPRVVAKRLQDTSRPLLAGDDPLEHWERIFAERLPFYEEVADVTFDTSSGPLSGVVTAICDWAGSEHRAVEEKA